MGKNLQMEQAWRDVPLPVLCFEVTGGQCALLFQNPATEALCRPAGTLLEVLPDPEAAGLLAQAAAFSNDAEPLFCHIADGIYSALFFPWDGYSVCMLHDVTAYHRGVQTKLDEAVMANRAKTNFLSEISHDIRTPMNAIIGMTDIALTQQETPPRIREYLGKIKTASGHMMSIINEVLDMSRIESGKIILEPEEVEIADVLHEILIVARSQADVKKLHFVLDFGRIDHERIVADAVRFKQICLNLLSNAIKFTPEGGTVTLFMEILQQPDPAFVTMNLRVQDTGIGMSREFLARIFMPFEREQSLTVSKIQGTGLGTAIAKNLVELMDGTISVRSAPGQGSCFQIAIPFRTADKNLDMYRQALHGRRLLLLDDQEKRAEMVVQMAQKIGMTADWAKGAEQAVSFINEAAFADTEYFAFLAAEKTAGLEMLSFLPEVRRRMGSAFPILLLAEGDWKQTEYMFTRAGVDAFVPLPLFASRLYAGLYAFTDEGRTDLEAQSAGAPCRYEDKKILLVEDNELNREIALEMLAMTGADVDTAADGAEALETFQSRPLFYYDLIFMDIQMPRMNGLEAARALRALDRPDALSTPIVAMTANAFVEDVKNSLNAGMNAHIPKPLDMDALFSCLDRFLGRRDG